MSLAAREPLPRWLEGQRDRYSEIITKERRLFKLSLLWRLGLAILWLVLVVWVVSSSTLTILLFVLLMLPGIDLPGKRRVSREREQIQQYFAREGMRIHHDLNLEIHIEKVEG